jgi:hypothetical protein
MDWHDYITGELIGDRVAELRAQAALERRLAAARPPRRPLRATIGGTLIRLGSWIVGERPDERLKASYRRA